MSIIKEHYRDFLGALMCKIEKIEAEIQGLDLEDESACFEYEIYNHELSHFAGVRDYLTDESRWVYFDSLESLKGYVQTLDNAYESMTAYVNVVLPVDGGELVGITAAEWDQIESIRYELLQKFKAWSLFEDFCESGDI